MPQNLSNEVQRLNEVIYVARGFCNTYLVTTREGNVVIDTSMPEHAQWHVKLLKEVNAGPVRYVIVTHSHRDHTGGVSLWREPATKVIAQREYLELLNYHRRLKKFFSRREAAQFGSGDGILKVPTGDYSVEIRPAILVNDEYEFSLAGTRFQMYHTPGETPDHLTVWVPKYRAAFVGDNYYESFPNLYTLRGTKPRWALDYIASLEKVLALRPAMLLPTHGPAITREAAVTQRLTKYRDAIQYVHDRVVKMMNEGKDVFEAMQGIRLPRELDLGEGYGKLTWSIRGIYEGYAGWFDANPASMYDTPASSAYPELVWLAGGPGAITRLAVSAIQKGNLIKALHLTNIALNANSRHRGALIVQLKVLNSLREKSTNRNERGWLESSMQAIKSKLLAIAA